MDKFINKFNQHTKRLINEEEIKLQLFDENGKILLIPFKKIPGPRGELMLEVSISIRILLFNFFII